MALELYNSNWYFHDVLTEEEQQDIRNNFSQFIDDDNNFEFHAEWDQQLRFTSNKQTYLPWDKYCYQLTRSFNLFTKEVGKRKEWTILPRSNWICKYNKGYNQGTQCYCDRKINLMMVYFYDIDENDTLGFRFHHQENTQYETNGLAEFFDLPLNQFFVPEVQKGSLIIFPSHTPHLEMSYKGDAPKVTFCTTMQVVTNRWPDEDKLAHLSDKEIIENPVLPMFPLEGWKYD